MGENHLEPSVDSPENPCAGFCDKIMKNMVLTLTILGRFCYIQVLRAVGYMFHVNTRVTYEHDLKKVQRIKLDPEFKGLKKSKVFDFDVGKTFHNNNRSNKNHSLITIVIQLFQKVSI